MEKIRPLLALTGVCATLLWAGSGASYAAGAADADGDGVPDTAEALLGTDPQNPDTDGDGANDLADTQPVSLPDPIAAAAGGTPRGLEIVSAKVEDNYDPAARKDAPDHLELEVKNLTDRELSGLQLYYTVTDTKTGATESYFVKLDGLMLPKGGAQLVHLDTSGTDGHFRANPNSSYYRTPNAKTLTVKLAAPGLAPAQVKLDKDEGGAEEAD